MRLPAIVGGVAALSGISGLNDMVAATKAAPLLSEVSARNDKGREVEGLLGRARAGSSADLTRAAGLLWRPWSDTRFPLDPVLPLTAYLGAR